MKILQIFGWVLAIHFVAFFSIFASPGCTSSPRNVPTPDATVPSVSSASSESTYNAGLTESAPPADRPFYVAEAPGRVAPTRPGSPNAAAIAPVKSAANVTPVTPYTIKRGDSLWTIAKKHNITVTELSKANNLSGSVALQPGKTLMIPGKPVAAPAPTENALALPVPVVSAPTETARPSAGIPNHVVASGESLGTIARKYQVTVGELAKANNITDPAKIRVGQPLIIPGGKHSGSRSATASASKPATSAPAVKPAASVPAPQPEQPAAQPAPQFEVKPPPPGQDLDAGLKDNTSTEVPTIKVEEAKPEEAPKS